MKFSTIKKWNTDFSHVGLLYFAHRCEEMLFHYSDDLFKIPTTNTRLLAKEYCNMSKEAFNADIKSANLKIILDEFIRSIQSDIVIKACWGTENIQRLVGSFGQSTEQDNHRTMTLVYSIFSNKTYYNWCIKVLNDLVGMPKEKKKIDLVSRYIIPELIDYGYSPEYIYYAIRLVFFQNQVSSLSVLNNFFSCFSFKSKKYNVYLAVSKEILFMKNTIEKRMNIVLNDDGNFSKLYADNDMKIILIPNLDAFDESSALKYAMNYVDLLIQFYSFIGNRRKMRVQDDGLVYDIDQKKFIIVKSNRHNLHAISTLDQEVILNFVETGLVIMVNGAKSSFREIYKAINLHNSALSARDHKSSFQNMWSILEVLCCTNRIGNKAELVSKYLIPVLKMDYVYTIINSIHEMLENCMNEKFVDLLSKIDDSDNIKEQVLCFVVLDKYERLRAEICGTLSDYPVVINRMFVLHEILKSKSSFLEEIDRHGIEAEYQLRRIYRTRNMIVHMGEEPRNMPLLCEYLHIYTDALLLEIVGRLAMYKNVMSIDSIMTDILFSYLSFESDIKSINSIDRDFLIRIMNTAKYYSTCINYDQ